MSATSPDNTAPPSLPVPTPKRPAPSSPVDSVPPNAGVITTDPGTAADAITAVKKRERAKRPLRCAHPRCKKKSLVACGCQQSYCIQHFTPASHSCTRVSENAVVPAAVRAKKIDKI